jgi:excinuclease ABC subunit A
LLKAFYALIEIGHTVIVVEHNMDVIKCADWIVDLGPKGGEEGGNLVFQGTPEDMIKNKKSVTAVYLKEKLT